MSEAVQRCTKCGETKPLIAFSLRKARDPNGPRRTQCKACNAAYSKQYRKDGPSVVSELVRHGMDNYEALSPKARKAVFTTDPVDPELAAAFKARQAKLARIDALRAAKARGTWTKPDGTPYKSGNRLGNPNGAAPLRRAAKGNVAAVEACKAGAQSRALELAAEIKAVRAAGAQSLREIAQKLNERHIEAPRGGSWHPSGVKRLLERLEA